MSEAAIKRAESLANASPAHKLYAGLLASGQDAKTAAKAAQQETGFALRTGGPIKQRKLPVSQKGRFGLSF
jgi:hypothetical protein